MNPALTGRRQIVAIHPHPAKNGATVVFITFWDPATNNRQTAGVYCHYQKTPRRYWFYRHLTPGTWVDVQLYYHDDYLNIRHLVRANVD